MDMEIPEASKVYKLANNCSSFPQDDLHQIFKWHFDQNSYTALKYIVKKRKYGKNYTNLSIQLLGRASEWQYLWESA